MKMCIVAMALFLSLGFGDKKARLPTIASLSGVWVGMEQGELDYYRLELTEDGTGTLVDVFLTEKAHTWVIERWTLEDRHIEVDLDSESKQVSTIRSIIGQIDQFHIKVTLEGNRWKRTATLWRESDLETRSRLAHKSVEQSRTRRVGVE